MLSGRDIVRWFENVGLTEPIISTYTEMDFSENIIYEDRAHFILYEVEPNIGHWTVLFYDRVADMPEFFDSYGYYIDEELQFTFHKIPKLLDVIVQDGIPTMEINDICFQKEDPEVQTCGVWCCLRYLSSVRGMSKELFDKTFYNIDEDIRDGVAAIAYNAAQEYHMLDF